MTLRVNGALVALFFFLLLDVTGGLVRFYLASHNLHLLAYVPKLLLLGLIALDFIKRGMRGMLNRLLMVSVGLIAWSIGTALVNGQSFVQVGFGVFILVPLLFGLVYGAELVSDEGKLRATVLVLWTIAIVGVCIDAIWEMPWTGQSFDLAGIEMQVSREWTTQGLARVAGFSHASYVAASHLAVFGLVLLGLTRSPIFRWVIFLISTAGIVLTTSKTMLLAFFLSAVLLRLVPRIPNLLWRAVPVTLILIGIALPIVSIFGTIDVSPSDELGVLLFGSIIERFQTTWPDVVSLVMAHGNPIVGRGIGGIGTPQLYFEPQLYSAADNLYVYVWAVSGIVGLMLVFFFFWQWVSTSRSSIMASIAYGLVILVLISAITTNVLESSILSLIVGTLLSVSQKKNSMAVTPSRRWAYTSIRPNT